MRLALRLVVSVPVLAALAAPAAAQNVVFTPSADATAREDSADSDLPEHRPARAARRLLRGLALEARVPALRRRRDRHARAELPHARAHGGLRLRVERRALRGALGRRELERVRADVEHRASARRPAHRRVHRPDAVRGRHRARAARPVVGHAGRELRARLGGGALRRNEHARVPIARGLAPAEADPRLRRAARPGGLHGARPRGPGAVRAPSS